MGYLFSWQNLLFSDSLFDSQLFLCMELSGCYYNSLGYNSSHTRIPQLDGTLHKKMKFSMKDFVSKCGQIRRKLRIWSDLMKKSLMKNFIFCTVATMLHQRVKHLSNSQNCCNASSQDMPVACLDLIVFRKKITTVIDEDRFTKSSGRT